MTEESYLSLTRFIEQQVRIIKQPFKLDSKLERLIDAEEYSRRDIGQALQTINAKVSSHYQKNFSKQAISQVADQIQQLWEEQRDEKRASLRSVVGTDVPVDIRTDYKVYVLDDILEEVKCLPEVEDEHYTEYNEARTILLNKAKKVEELKRKIELIHKYEDLMKAKIGDRAVIQKNLPISGRDELREEMAKSRVILQKLTNLSGSRKEKLKQLLKQEHN